MYMVKIIVGCVFECAVAPPANCVFPLMAWSWAAFLAPVVPPTAVLWVWLRSTELVGTVSLADVAVAARPVTAAIGELPVVKV